MTRTQAALALVIVVAGLSGCASMSESQCRVADWRDVGFKDGSAGYDVNRLQAHREACAKAGVRPDEAAWLAAYEQGLTTRFCTPRGGFESGRSGFSDARVCPEGLRPAFMSGYAMGASIRAAASDLSRVESGIRQYESELSKPGIPKEKRDVMLIRLQTMQAERLDLRRRLEMMEYDARMRLPP